jgi:GNAT superfamily N-acetyltransferase
VPTDLDVVFHPARADDLAAVVAIDAEAGGRCAGFVVGEIRAWEFGSPPSGWIFAVAVLRSAREHGVGGLLFEAVCAHFRAVGVQRVRTMLGKNDLLVMSFFRGQGMMAGPFIQLEKGLRP